MESARVKMGNDTQSSPATAPDKKAGTYFRNIAEATRTLLHGLRLTWRHFKQARKSRKPMGVADADYFEQQTGIVTLQYPKESFPVPDNGRYRLHNEIDDCIVCDKCAKICPVDCIEIEPVKAVETFGQTSDGTPKRIYAARFDIDMAKCCFCGLCTTVCPTECLTMTKAYDFSEFDVADHTYAFAEMSPLEILQKKQEQEAFQAEKAAKAAAAGPAVAKPGVARPGMPRPATAPKPAAARPAPPRPGIPKPATATDQPTSEDVQEAARRLMEQKQASMTPNPVAKSAPTPQGTENSPAPGANKPHFKPRVVVKPKITTAAPEAGEEKSAASAQPSATTETTGSSTTPAAKLRPLMKPVIKKTATPPAETTPAAQDAAAQDAATKAPETTTPAPKPRPVMKPVIRRATPPESAAEGDQTTRASASPNETQGAAPADAGRPKPRPVIKPVIRKATPPASATDINPQNKAADLPAGEMAAPAPEGGEKVAEAPKRPRPVMKPIVPKPTMQAKPTPGQEGAGDQDIKKPQPIVNPKEVVRKPAQEDKTEDDKRQEEPLRPGPAGHPDNG